MPAAHLLRGIDRFLDLARLIRELKPSYSHTGRPWIDPELTFARRDFSFDPKNDRYMCPGGRYLESTARPTAEGTILYRSKNLECASCLLKPRCCPNTPNRRIARSVHESSRDIARALATTDAYRQSCKERKKVEILFAHLKRILKL